MQLANGRPNQCLKCKAHQVGICSFSNDLIRNGEMDPIFQILLRVTSADAFSSLTVSGVFTGVCKDTKVAE